MAQRRVRKVLDSQRRADGTWDEVVVASPLGAALRVYLGPDKSLKTIRTEQASKRLRRAVECVCAGRRVDVVRRTGAVCIDWVQAAKIEVRSESETVVLWNPVAVRDFKMDKDQIMQQFNEGPAPPAAVQWSI